ncbi:hypothetical protein Hanom_Chr03g00199321 [Helianthus anomalus]
MSFREETQRFRCNSLVCIDSYNISVHKIIQYFNYQLVDFLTLRGFSYPYRYDTCIRCSNQHIF